MPSVIVGKAWHECSDLHILSTQVDATFIGGWFCLHTPFFEAWNTQVAENALKRSSVRSSLFHDLSRSWRGASLSFGSGISTRLSYTQLKCIYVLSLSLYIYIYICVERENIYIYIYIYIYMSCSKCLNVHRSTKNTLHNWTFSHIVDTFEKVRCRCLFA